MAEKITDKDKLQVIVDKWNDGYRKFKINEPYQKELIEAIKNATNGSFIGDNWSSTLMGYSKEYDSKGREITCDPNYKDSEINITGTIYPITRVGWKAYIWKPEIRGRSHYTLCWSASRYCSLLAIVDLRPDYVKEYQKAKNKDDKPIEWKDYYVEDDYIVNPINNSHGFAFNDGTIMWKNCNGMKTDIIFAPYIITDNTPTVKN